MSSGGWVVFQGESDHSVDDKGRVIIPSRFRSSLGERFNMTKGIGGCIFIYTASAFKTLTDTLQNQRQLDEHTMRLQRFFTSTEATADGQGRVAIPSNLRDWAQISENSEVVMVGTGSRIEIWSHERWDNYNKSLTDLMISESAREIGIG